MQFCHRGLIKKAKTTFGRKLASHIYLRHRLEKRQVDTFPIKLERCLQSHYHINSRVIMGDNKTNDRVRQTAEPVNREFS
jgi:hypothetical protein